MEAVERIFKACSKTENWKEITSKEIEKFIYWNKKRSDWTKRVYAVQIRAFLRFCRSFDLPVINPEQIAVRKYFQKEAKYLKKEEEIEMLAELQRERLIVRTAILLMLWTGMRIKEACTLTKEQLKRAEFIDWVFQVPIEWKWGKTRAIFISSTIYQYCLLRAKRHENKTVLWVQTHEIQKQVKKFSERIWIKFTPHTLRHTYLTKLAQKWADLYKIQKIAGHSSITTTSRYLHTHNKELAETAKLVAEVYC